MEKKFIVTVELGSSKVTAVAGRREPDGVISILASVQEPSADFIRKGRINNVSKMRAAVQKIRETLEQSIERKKRVSLKGAFVGITGMGMYTTKGIVRRTFAEKVEISQNDVDELREENQRSAATPDRDVLESVALEYRLGAQRQSDPVGIMTDSIEGEYLNVMAGTTMCSDVAACFEEGGLPVLKQPIAFEALADAMLADAEKRSGCVFVDMGAETTSVAVYKNNLLRHLAVIPLGGANVTHDISSLLQVDENEAEALKLRYGRAISAESDIETAAIVLQDGRSVSHSELAELIEARMEEILRNVKHQIELSGYGKGTLIAGVIFTGGAAQMRDCEKAICEFTGFDKVRHATHTRLSVRGGGVDFNKDGSQNVAIALIDKCDDGEVNCCAGEDDRSDIFGGSGGNREQAEAEAAAAREKAEAEEAERVRKARLEEIETEVRREVKIDKKRLGQLRELVAEAKSLGGETAELEAEVTRLETILKNSGPLGNLRKIAGAGWKKVCNIVNESE